MSAEHDCPDQKFCDVGKFPKKTTMVPFDILFPLFFCLATLWYIKILWVRRRFYYYSRNVPGPIALPLIGSAHYALLNLGDIFGTIRKMVNAYPGGIFRIWIGTYLHYVITEPKYLEILLTNPNCLEKPKEYQFLRPIVALGLFTAPAQIWKRTRKIVSPAFNQRVLDQFVETFAQNSDVLVEELKKYCGRKGDEIDLFHIFSRCTLDIICETAMGTKVNAQTTNCKFSMWSDRAMEIVMQRFFNVLYHNETIFGMSSAGKEFKKVIENINNFTLKVIKEKRMLYQNRKNHVQENQENNLNEGKDIRKKALLDYLIELSENEDKPFTDDELMGEVNTFIIAGSDTTATTSCFAVTALGVYQDVQQKAYEEIMDVLGPDKPVEYSDLANLKYLERVIKETSRIFSAASYVGRRITADIDIGDYILPKDSELMLIFFHAHVNSKYWPDPYKFDPDRFLPEEVAKRPPCVYLPFSHGPRNCIGMKYAMMSMKAILATIIRKYKFFTDYKSIEDIGLKSNLVLRAKDGYKVTFEPRE